MRASVKSVRRFAALHPEWWCVAIAVAAWAVLLVPFGNGREFCAPSPPNGPVGLLRETGKWLVMVAAMMLPLVVIPLRETAFCSLRKRRHLAMAEFIAGYFGPWLAAGLLVSLLSFHEFSAGGSTLPAVVAFVAAAIWHHTRWRRAAAVACHWTRPLAPSGWSATRDVLEFGVQQGTACVINCGALMLATTLSPSRLLAMIVATAILTYERYRARPPRRPAIPLVIGVLAVFHALYR